MIGRAQLANLLRDQRGGSAVEFALVVPFVILIFFAAIGGGVLAYATVSLQRATEVTARCLSMASGNCPASGTTVNTYGTDNYHGPSLSGLSFSASQGTCSTTAYKVSGTGTFSAFPGLDFLSVTLHANACYPGVRT